MDFLKVAVIVLFVVLTILAIKIHPEMHLPMIIEDANFQLVRISDTLTNNIPTAPVKPKTETKSQPQVQIQPATKTIQVIQEETPKKIIKIKPTEQTSPQKEQTITTPVPQKSQIEILQDLLNTDIEDTKNLEENSKKLVQSLEPPKQQTNNTNPYMTEQEEIIAWNKWRSNIQNRIMQDSQIDYAPLGTMFSFTFVVDRYGNVSNIKVNCSNPNLMNIALNNVKPAIANLQKKPILVFPRGTRRASTVVTGVFIIGTQERYSTPDDYSDYERVRY